MFKIKFRNLLFSKECCSGEAKNVKSFVEELRLKKLLRLQRKRKSEQSSANSLRTTKL